MVKKNQIGLFSVVAISVTSMVGSGWLFSAQLSAKAAGNYAFIAWVIAAIIALSVGLCFVRISSLYPERGLNSKCTTITHGKDFGVICGFAIWFGLIVITPTEAQATTQYLSPLISSFKLFENEALTIYGKIFSIGLLSLYLLINYFGIKLLTKINNVATVLKVGIPFLTIAILFIAHFDHSNFSLQSNDHYDMSYVTKALIGAGLIYAFNGFQVIFSFSSEIRNPKTNIPLALIISIALTLLLYVLLQIAFMGAIPTDMALKGWSNLNFQSPLVDLTMLIGLNFFAMILVTDAIVSPSITGMTYLGACSRMLYAMADKKQIPMWFAKICPKRLISKRSLFLNFIFCIIILLNSSSWAALMILATVFNVIGYMGAPLALAVIRKNKLIKLFSLFVFVMLSILLSTVGISDLLMANIVLTVVFIIYAFMQYKLANFNYYSLYFFVFLWIYLLASIYSTYLVVLIAMIFFITATSKKYIKLVFVK